MINDMDIKDKLRLAICMRQSKWSGLMETSEQNKVALYLFNTISSKI